MPDDEVLNEETSAAADETTEEAAEEATEQTAETEVDEEKAELEKLKEQLDVQVEDLGVLQKKLTVTVPREFVDAKLDEQYSELSRDAVVPGFRKGRAPRRLLEKRFGGEVSDSITAKLVGMGYMGATEKLDLHVIGDPLIWCAPKKAGKDEEAVVRLMSVAEACDNLVLPEEGPLTFACEVETRPEFELPSLEKIPLKKPVVEITDEDIDRQIDRFRRMRGTYEPVTDGGVAEDDIATVSMKLTVDGEVIRAEDRLEVAARPQSIDGVLLEDLGKQFAGKRIGEAVTTTGTMPDDAEQETLRGKPAQFEFVIKEIQRLRVPELTAESLAPMGFDSMEEFRDYVRSNLEIELGTMQQRSLRQQVYNYLLENTKLDLPERLSQRQGERIMVRRMLDLYRQGVPESEVAKHIDELRTHAREEAARELKLSLVMETIAEDLAPQVTDEEVNAQIAMIAQQQNRRFDRVRDDLYKQGALESLYIQLRDEKIVDALIAQAEITEEAAPAAGKKKAAGAKEAAGEKEAAREEKPAAEKKATRKKGGRKGKTKKADEEKSDDAFADET
jgi:trigger factor